MKKIAYLFSGQGAQAIGMGKDIYEKYAYVREMFKEANNILGYKLEDILFTENDLLNQTKYTQTTILVVTCGLFEVIKRELNLTPMIMAGFSLGEYSALYASGIFSFNEILKLVYYRANFMDEAATVKQGSMAAVIGLEREILESICKDIGNVWIANYNTPSQLVISGLKDSIQKAVQIITTEYGKRAVILNVSGAFHSPLMEEAADKFESILNEFEPREPKWPIIMNYNAKQLVLFNLKTALKKQVYSPVYFSDTISLMIADYNIDMFVEIGPGRVLSGFVKKIDRSKEIVNFEGLQDIMNYKESK